MLLPYSLWQLRLSPEKEPGQRLTVADLEFKPYSHDSSLLTTVFRCMGLTDGQMDRPGESSDVTSHIYGFVFSL